MFTTFKTIGLLNIIGNSGQLKASIEVLKLSFELFENQLKYLQKKSLLNLSIQVLQNLGR